MTIFSIGHSTRSIEDFLDILRTWRIDVLADVRTVARSRHNPHFNEDQLSVAVAAEGMTYERMKELGGWRRPLALSVNGGWRLASFRGYADYMQTAEFASALDDLVARSTGHILAYMCAEAVPWRCHRSLIGDALVVRGIDVRDITSLTSAKAHRLTPFARVDGALLTYPPPVE